MANSCLFKHLKLVECGLKVNSGRFQNETRFFSTAFDVGRVLNNSSNLI